MEEPFQENLQGDEPEENLRYPMDGPFGVANTAWATMLDVRIRYRAILFPSRFATTGDLFSIRIKSPGFVETDRRFIGKQCIEMEEFDEQAARAAVGNIVESGGRLTFQGAMRALEEYFHIDDL